MGRVNGLLTPAQLFARTAQASQSVPVSDSCALSLSDLSTILCAGEQLRYVSGETPALLSFAGVLQRVERLSVVGLGEPDSSVVLRTFCLQYAELFSSLLGSVHCGELAAPLLSLFQRSGSAAKKSPLRIVLKAICAKPIPPAVAQAALTMHWELCEDRLLSLVLTALYRAVEAAEDCEPAAELARRHSQAVLEGTAEWWQVAFLLARQASRREMASDNLRAAISNLRARHPSQKLVTACIHGLQLLIDRDFPLEIVGDPLESVFAWLAESSVDRKADLMTGLYRSALRHGAAGRLDLRVLLSQPCGADELKQLLAEVTQREQITRLLPPSLTCDSVPVYVRLFALCEGPAEQETLHAAAKEQLKTLVDSSSDVAGRSLISLCAVARGSAFGGVQQAAVCLLLLLDFERRCWSSKQVDPKKGAAAVSRTLSDLRDSTDLPTNTDSMLLAVASSNFRQSYKCDMAPIDQILRESAALFDRCSLREIASAIERESLFADDKVSARILRQGRKTLEDVYNASRKVIQNCSLSELLVALLCSDLMKVSASPLALCMRLLRDDTLTEVTRGVLVGALKKVNCSFQGLRSVQVFTLAAELCATQSMDSQAIAREVFGFSDLDTKAARPLRCEEPFFEQFPEAGKDYKLFEAISAAFLRQAQGEPPAILSAAVFCEWVWRSHLQHPSLLEKMSALLTLKLWTTPECAALQQFLSASASWLAATDYEKALSTGSVTALNQWMKKKGRPAIIAALKGHKKRTSVLTELRIGVLAQTLLTSPQDSQLRSCVQECRKVVGGSDGKRLVRLVQKLEGEAETRLGLELCCLVCLAGAEQSVLGPIRKWWLSVLQKVSGEYRANPPNELLFLSDARDEVSAAPEAEIHMRALSSFIEDSADESCSLALTALQRLSPLPASLLFSLVGVVLRSCQSALQKDSIVLCVQKLLEFYAATGPLGTLGVAPAAVTATLRLLSDVSSPRASVSLAAGQPVDLPMAVAVLLVLVAEDAQLLDLTQSSSLDPALYRNPEQLLATAWTLSPALALRIWRQGAHALKSRSAALSAYLLRQLSEQAVATSAVFCLEGAERVLETQLAYVSPPTIPCLLQMLASDLQTSRSFAQRHLAKMTRRAWLFYLPQVLQLAGKKRVPEAAVLLREATASDALVRHRTQWLLQTLDDSDACELSATLQLLPHGPQSIFHALASLSLSLVPKDPVNVRVLAAKTAELNSSGEFPAAFPFSPSRQVVGLVPAATKPLRSAKRVPLYVELQCKDADGTLRTDPVIVKVNDDTRSDQLTMQFIELASSIFRSHGEPCYLRPYGILPLNLRTSEFFLGCLMEVVPDCKSRDELWTDGFESLSSFLASKAESRPLSELQRNLVESMAGYSLVCYLLQIKDRHNGNLLLDSAGHIIHIDFGFILTLSPGGNAGVENVEFKLTREMSEAMGGLESFKQRLVAGFLALREYSRELVALFDLTQDSGCTCFTPGAVSELAARFLPTKSRGKVAKHLAQMVYWAHDSMYTRMYDNMQKASQNIQC